MTTTSRLAENSTDFALISFFIVRAVAGGPLVMEQNFRRRDSDMGWI